jgi:DNA repair exonuclease SbcCD ATPase subunit
VLDIISTVTMLKGILDTAIDAATKYQVSPKRKVAKELLAVSRTLEDIENSIEEIITRLNEFSREEQVGMRVHHIHRVGQELRELQLLFRKFSIWMKKGRGISGVNMFSPSTMENLRRLHDLEDAEYEIQSAIDKLAEEIEAVRSPDPKKFPKPETITEFRGAMDTLLAETKKGREKLRRFVVKHFTLEDLF